MSVVGRGIPQVCGSVQVVLYQLPHQHAIPGVTGVHAVTLAATVLQGQVSMCLAMNLL